VGRLSLFLALTSLFALILVAPVSSYLTRRAIEWNAEGTLIQQLRRPLIYSCLSSTLAALVSIGLIRIGLLSASKGAAALIGLTVLSVGIGNFGSTLFNYLGRPFKYVILSCAKSWGGVALAALFCLRFSATAEGWLSGITGAQLFVGFVSIMLIRSMTRQQKKLSGPEPTLTSQFDLRTIGLYSAPL